MDANYYPIEGDSTDDAFLRSASWNSGRLTAGRSGVVEPYEVDVFAPVNNENACMPGTATELGVDAAKTQSDDRSWLQRRWHVAKEFTGRHKGKMVMGAVAVSAALTFANNPYEEVIDQALEAAPWVLSGVVVSEAAFVAGGIMMAGSVGNKIGNPLKIKEKIPEIAKQANDSLLFKSGFWVNTAGAVGTGVFLSAAIVGKMPPEAYGALSVTLVDLSLTCAVRKAMLDGIRKNSTATRTGDL